MATHTLVDRRPRLADAQAAPPDVIVGQKLYVRHGVLPRLDVRTRYTLDIYDEANCGKCSNRPNRPNDICAPCPNYKGRFRFDKDLRLRGTREQYHALPISDLGHVRTQLRGLPNFSDLKVANIIRYQPMNHPLTFKGTLFGENAFDKDGNPRANQQEIAAEWLKHKIGTIKAPPRTGKTVLATYLACELGVKTVIMAHQYKLLKQFFDTYMGTMDHPNPEKRRPPMTDAPELEKLHGKGTSVFLVKNIKQLLKFGSDPKNWPDILLINYQKFPHKIGRVAQFLNNNYSFKQVDEQHQGAADAYSRVLFAMTMPYSLGLSATPRRKDELDLKSQFTIGPIVAESQTISIPPIIETKFIEAYPDRDYSHWAFACRWARSSEERNDELLKEIFADLKAGHDAIIVPVGSRAVQTTLVDAVNAKIKTLRAHPKPAWREYWRQFPYPLALALNANSNQDAVIDRVDDGRPCVLVAIQSMIKQGIDMQVPSMIYLNEPLSAKRAIGAPMFEQLSFRVATPSPRKPMEPVVKILIDNISSFRGALTGLWWNEILPGSKKDATPNGPKYRLGGTTAAVLSGLKSEVRGNGRKKGKFKKTRKAATGGRWAA